MIEYLQNPIIFSIAMGVFVSVYMWFEDSLSDKGIANKTKYIRAFVVTAVAVNVAQTYAKKGGISSQINSYQQSYNVGQAPF
jgi:hypothetical protein